MNDTVRKLLASLTPEQRQRIVDLHTEARAIAARATAGRLQTEAMRLTLTDALAMQRPSTPALALTLLRIFREARQG